MPNPILPIQVRKTGTIPTSAVDPHLETMAQAHPPVIGYSDSAASAVNGTHTGKNPGRGVAGTSASGDGVHGEASGTGFSAVAGIHTGNGNGVYGHADPGAGGNAGFFDGNVQMTHDLQVGGNLVVTGDIQLPGADCAEQFDVAGMVPIEPGTLVVVDESGALRESVFAYDRKVAGVVAGAGLYRPGIILDKGGAGLGMAGAGTAGAPMADGRLRTAISLMGKAYCKVDASQGAIAVGDLLTSSDVPGHAMKAADAGRAFGAVVGKALRPVAEGQALIPILMALQ